MSTIGAEVPSTSDGLNTLVTIIDLVRTERAMTRPEIGRISELGRSVVTQRVEYAIDAGLLEDADFQPSTGGRAPRRLRFVSERALVLSAAFGAFGVSVAVTDLAGKVLAERDSPWEITEGPDKSFAHVAEVFDELIAEVGPREVWAVVIGIPGPVSFSTGRPIAPVIMPEWNGYDVRGWFEKRYGAPVWVDKTVNLMALGDFAGDPNSAYLDVLFVNVASGIGASLISSGRVHRGANGSAGDIAHMPVPEASSVACRCGLTGCLEALAGGWALARDGEEQARSGRSAFLAERLAAQGSLRPLDVVEGSQKGDQACVELVVRSGRLIGESMAALVNFFNPAVLTVGGVIPRSSDVFVATVRQAVYQRSLPLATRDLRIVPSVKGYEGGAIGGAMLAIDQLFSVSALKLWALDGSPLDARTELYQLSRLFA